MVVWQYLGVRILPSVVLLYVDLPFLFKTLCYVELFFHCLDIFFESSRFLQHEQVKQSQVLICFSGRERYTLREKARWDLKQMDLNHKHFAASRVTTVSWSWCAHRTEVHKRNFGSYGHINIFQKKKCELLLVPNSVFWTALHSVSL